MIVLRALLTVLWWAVWLVLAVVVFAAAFAVALVFGLAGQAEVGEAVAERGRKWWLGRLHPTSHLHRGVRP